MSFTDIVLGQPIQSQPPRRGAEVGGSSIDVHSYHAGRNESGDGHLHHPMRDISASIPALGLEPLEGSQFPLKEAQEACLFRYFIDELSHWFDLCDEDRHFQLVVPRRAQAHPHLLNAIFAVAARHLSRVPQYKTPQGIKYHGKLLPHLNTHSAVEYMLRCIPALRQYHGETSDDGYRDSIIATAVILRQLEEIDDDDDDDGSSVEGSTSHLTPGQRLNFLPIIDAVLRSPASQAQVKHKSLMRAAYWMALRQEIYYSFTRRQPPQLILSLDLWSTASKVNKTVMHTVQVAKWRWGNGSNEEWFRLREQQELVEKDVLLDFQPIFRQEADRSRGEIFPTAWYASNIEVTSVQQAIMAKMVLIADDPFLRGQNSSRGSWRRSETDVRQLVLELCGIALCHPASPPALVNAAIGVQLYGDFFTDGHERRALRGVLERYGDAHAWPVQKMLDKFAECR